MEFLLLLPFLIVALTIHEFAHALVAYKLGDTTPKMQGRVTLNPLAHLDPIGTLVLIVSSIAGVGFGWGKPVSFNPYNFKKPKRDTGLVAAAGPISNLIMVVIAIIAMRLVNWFIPPSVTAGDLTIFTGPNMFINSIIVRFIFINLVLATFNLIPIYPLDGFNVLMSLLPHKYSAQFAETARYGTILLLVLILSGATQIIISPVVRVVMIIISILAG